MDLDTNALLIEESQESKIILVSGYRGKLEYQIEKLLRTG